MEKDIIKEKGIVWLAYELFIFFALLVSFRAWFTWEIPTRYLGLIFVAVSSPFFVVKNSIFTMKIEIPWFVFLFLIFFFGYLSYGSQELIINSIRVFSIVFILMIKSEYKNDLFNTIRIILSIMLGISLLGWILFLIGIPTPYIVVEMGEDSAGNVLYIYENHFLFLVNRSNFVDLYVHRFCSFFLEPGYLGCLVAMILYIDNYRINILNVILFLSLVLSFSLAGYIIFIFGFLYTHLKKVEIWKVISIGLAIVFLYLFFLNYNNGNNIVNDLIISRLEYDEKEMTISGYNRSQEQDNYMFWHTFIHRDELFLGTKKPLLGDNNVDWKAYIVTHGLISFIFFIMFLIFPCLKKRKRKSVAGLSIIYFLIFAQTISLALSMMYLTLYVLGVNRLRTLDYTTRILKEQHHLCYDAK